jgi:hypothetical protein
MGFNGGYLGSIRLMTDLNSPHSIALFRRNSAARGGGVFSNECEHDVENALFDGNVAAVVATTDSAGTGIAGDKPVSSTTLFGGGAVVSDSDRRISWTNLRFLNNAALRGLNGGAMWIRPLPGMNSAKWMYYASDQVMDANNSADAGGGGFLYWRLPLDANGDVIVTPLFSFPSGATPSATRNRALYGDVVATQWVQLQALDLNATTVEQDSDAPLKGRLEVALVDMFGQIVRSESSLAARLQPLEASVTAIGEVVIPAAKGVFNWTSRLLRVQGPPGSSVGLRVGSDTWSSVVDMALQLRTCRPGEMVVPGVACADCAPGRYSSETSSATCSPCPMGTFSDASGSSACTQCDSRMYTSREGSVECLSCGSFHYARRGFNSTIGCEECPPNVDCVSYDKVEALTGFWLNTDSHGYLRAVPCGLNRCLGGGRCAPGRVSPDKNPLCGSCMDGFSLWAGSCIDCRSTSTGVRVALVLLLVAGSLAVVYLFHFLASRPSSSGRLKILLYFLQVSLLIVGPSRDPRVQGADAVVSLDPTRVFTTHCLALLSQYAQMMIGFMPLAVASGGLLVVMGGSWGVARFRGAPFDARRYAASWVALFVLSFLPVVTAAFDFFNCVNVPVGDSVRTVVFRFPDVLCTSSEWRASSVFAGFILALFLVVAPAGIFYVLRHAWRDADARPADVAKWSALHHVDAYLSSAYRREVSFYEVVLLLRRVVLIAINVFLANAADPLDRLFVSALANLLFLVVHGALRPFRADDENVVETVSLTLLVALPVVLGLFRVPLVGSRATVLFVVFIFLPSVCMALWVARDMWVRRRRRAQRASVEWKGDHWDGRAPLLVGARDGDGEAESDEYPLHNGAGSPRSDTASSTTHREMDVLAQAM